MILRPTVRALDIRVGDRLLVSDAFADLHAPIPAIPLVVSVELEEHGNIAVHIAERPGEPVLLPCDALVVVERADSSAT